MDQKPTLESLWNKINDWAKKQFPNSTPTSKAAHLLKEAQELAADPTNPKEMADVQILLINLAGACGLTPGDLLKAVAEKHEINLARAWGQPDENGVVEHIRGGQKPEARFYACQFCGRKGASVQSNRCHEVACPSRTLPSSSTPGLVEAASNLLAVCGDIERKLRSENISPPSGFWLNRDRIETLRTALASCQAEPPHPGLIEAAKFMLQAHPHKESCPFWQSFPVQVCTCGRLGLENALAECGEDEYGPEWVCLDCGNTDPDKMKDVVYESLEGEDYDMECLECHSKNIEEGYRNAISTIAEERDELKAERGEWERVTGDSEILAFPLSSTSESVQFIRLSLDQILTIVRMAWPGAVVMRPRGEREEGKDV